MEPFRPVQFLPFALKPPTFYYTEILPIESLLPFIACFWEMRSTDPMGTFTNRVLPDCCMDLVVDVGNENAFLAGLAESTEYLVFTGNVSFFGIRFLPASIPHVWGESAQGTVGKNLPLFGNVPALVDIILNTMGQERIDRLNRELFKFFLGYEPNFRMGRILRQSLASNNGLTVRSLADSQGISERHLHRLFINATGLSPKTFLRISRFQNLLPRLGRSGRSSAILALKQGFYDQSHLHRELSFFLQATIQ